MVEYLGWDKVSTMIVKAWEKTFQRKMVNYIFLKCKFLLLFAFLCLFFVNRTNATSQSFGFSDTGQQLGQIADDVASIACGDMDNDGYVDLILASQESGTIIQLYLNDGKGNFTKTKDTFPVTDDSNPLWNFGIVLRDFNRDAQLDIATADAWRGVNIYLKNTKNGSFEWAQAILVPEVNEVKGIDAADVDNDGDDDIVFGGHNGIPDRGDRVYLNDGLGYFVDSGQQIGSDVTWDTIFGDIDNDGDFDYISINRYGEHTSKIHLNNGSGVFDDTIDIPTTQTDDSHDVKLADLNTDGLLDIVIANSVNVNGENGTTTSKIFINKSNHIFELAEDTLGEPNCETKGIEVVDVTNDGYYDIVLGNYNIANMIYQNDGTGKFEKMDIEIPTNQATAIAAVDVNNDGFIDLVIGNAADSHYKVYLNTGGDLEKNLAPEPPPTLESEINYDDINLSWESGFDLKTHQKGLTYNIRIGRQPGGNDIVSGVSASGTGHLGNALLYRIKGLEKGIFYWSVQTVDSSFKKSEWSQAEQFEISESYTECNPASITASTSKLIIKVTQSGEVTVTVKGEDDCLSEGVKVNAKISKSGKEKVSVSPESITTDGNGDAIFTFTGVRKGKAKATFNAEGVEDLDEKVKILIKIK